MYLYFAKSVICEQRIRKSSLIIIKRLFDNLRSTEEITLDRNAFASSSNEPARSPNLEFCKKIIKKRRSCSPYVQMSRWAWRKPYPYFFMEFGQLRFSSTSASLDTLGNNFVFFSCESSFISTSIPPNNPDNLL